VLAPDSAKVCAIGLAVREAGHDGVGRRRRAQGQTLGDVTGDVVSGAGEVDTNLHRVMLGAAPSPVPSSRRGVCRNFLYRFKDTPGLAGGLRPPSGPTRPGPVSGDRRGVGGDAVRGEGTGCAGWRPCAAVRGRLRVAVTDTRQHRASTVVSARVASSAAIDVVAGGVIGGPYTWVS